MNQFERIEPSTAEWTAFYANHIQRYMFAAEKLQRLPKRALLDVACGVGYGSYHLAEAGTWAVTAVDRDARALQIGRHAYSHPRVRYCQDDCQTLQGAGKHGPFDAVISFETVEHLQQPAAFLRRCRELLTPEGVLVISTPNRSRSGPGAVMQSVFHEKEYTADEFLTLLDKCGFRTVHLYGQQLTPLGQLRTDIRAELHLVRFNPFVRLGLWLQRILRGVAVPRVVLPEQLADLEIVPLASSAACDALGKHGPLVLLAVAHA